MNAKALMRNLKPVTPTTTAAAASSRSTFKECKRFDWFRIIKGTAIEPLVQELVEEVLGLYKASLQGASTSTRRKDITQICRQLLSALFIVCDDAEWSDTEIKPVSYPLSKGAYGKNDPNKVPLSYRYCKQVLQAACNLGWVTINKGKEGRYTRISPTEIFRNKVYPDLLTWIEQELLPDESLVRMKDVVRDEQKRIVFNKKGSPKKVLVRLKHDERVQEWINELRAYNQYISQQCISLNVTDKQLIQIQEEINKKKQYTDLNPRNVQLYRSFSLNDYRYGGRLYGGFWQGIPQIYRPHILINDMPTGEMDYSGMSIVIIYSLIGQKFDVKNDPYDIGLEGFGPHDPRRKIVKKILLALINDIYKTYKVPRIDLRRLALTENELMERFKIYHPALVDIFRSDYGLRAQHEDSKIVMQMLNYGIQEGIPILPIHDSFIAPLSYIPVVLPLMMKRIMRDSLNVECNITQVPLKTNKLFGWSDQEVIEFAKDPENCVVKVSDCYDSWIYRYDKGQKMRNYYNSYERLKIK